MTWEELSRTQANIAKILTNSLSKNRVAHAYLFEGPRGCGKMNTALLLTKTFFCKEKVDDNPCHVCTDCKRIESGNHPDAHIIEPDGNSIKKEQIEYLRKEFSYRGMETKRKVYIVDDAEKMTASAANSILKFLEEPIGESIAILLTTNSFRILNTIVSRSQVLSFLPLAPERLQARLKEEGLSETDSLIVSHLTSDLAEAIQLCQDNWIAQARDKVIQLVSEVYLRPKNAFITLQEGWMDFFKEKQDMQLGLDLLAIWYRDVIRYQLDQEDKIVYIDQTQQLQEQSLKISQVRLGSNLQAVMDAKRKLDANTAPQLLMEQLLLRLQEG